MTTHTIRRQHEHTSIPELYGKHCAEFKVVLRESDNHYGPMFLHLSGVWHRFYLDAGLLFWEEGPGPDPENDLLDGERYTDFASRLGVIGIPISRIEMDGSRLRLDFDNGARLVLGTEVEDDGAVLIELVVGKCGNSDEGAGY